MIRVALAIVLASPGGGQHVARQCQTAQGYQAAQVQYQSAPVYAQQVYSVPYGIQTQFVAVEQAYDPYYSALVGTAARQQTAQLGANNLANQVAQLSATVAQLTQTIANKAVPVTPPVQPPVVNNHQPPPIPQPPVVVPPPPVPAGVPNAEVTAILTNNCAKCHTTGALKKGAMTLFEADGKTLVAFSPADLLLIDQAIFSGDMPRNAKPLADKDYTAVRSWINERKDEITNALKSTKGN